MSVSRISALGAVALSGALALSACGVRQQSGAAPGAGSTGCRLHRRRRLLHRHPERPRAPRPRRTPSTQAIKAYQTDVHRRDDQLQPDRLRRRHQAVHRQAGRLRRLRLGAQDRPRTARSRPRTPRPPAAPTPGTCPMVAGPIAIAYNVKGVDKLVLNAEVAAKIFNGKITTWNDPAIAALNPGVTLPATPIKVVLPLRRVGHHRELHQVPQGRRRRRLDRRAPARSGPARARARRSRPVSPARSKGHDGGITYVELVLRHSRTSWPWPRSTPAPAPVELTAESAGKTIATAKQTGTGNDLALKIDYATKAAGRLPDRPGDLRDRLLEVRRRRDGQDGQGLPRRLRLGRGPEGPRVQVGYAPLPTEVADQGPGRGRRDLLNSPDPAERSAGSTTRGGRQTRRPPLRQCPATEGSGLHVSQ